MTIPGIVKRLVSQSIPQNPKIGSFYGRTFYIERIYWTQHLSNAHKDLRVVVCIKICFGETFDEFDHVFRDSIIVEYMKSDVLNYNYWVIAVNAYGRTDFPRCEGS